VTHSAATSIPTTSSPLHLRNILISPLAGRHLHEGPIYGSVHGLQTQPLR
jgi:hypothetical protein